MRIFIIDISNQHDAAKLVSLVPSSLLGMFRVTVSPIFRSTLTVYTELFKIIVGVLTTCHKQ